MSSFEEVNSARDKLMEALGDKSKQYMQHMKLWFQMKSTKVDFDLEARKLLDPSQIHLHNQFLLQLFMKCSTQDLPAASPPLAHHRTKTKRRARQHNGGFQQANIHDYVASRLPPRAQEEPPRYCVQELFLPDAELVHMRMMLAAWELGLKGAEQAAAEILVQATQQFLKNIITAVLSRRNGFCVNSSGVQYAIGVPVPNPWLRNTANYVNSKPDGLVLEVVESGEAVPTGRPTVAEMQQDIAVAYAAGVVPLCISGCLWLALCARSVLEVVESGEAVPTGRPTVAEMQQDIAVAYAAGVERVDKKPVTAAECYEALKIYRFPSNGVYSINMERISAQLHHPSWDDMGE